MCQPCTAPCQACVNASVCTTCTNVVMINVAGACQCITGYTQNLLVCEPTCLAPQLQGTASFDITGGSLPFNYIETSAGCPGDFSYVSVAWTLAYPAIDSLNVYTDSATSISLPTVYLATLPFLTPMTLKISAVVNDSNGNSYTEVDTKIVQRNEAAFTLMSVSGASFWHDVGNNLSAGVNYSDPDSVNTFTYAWSCPASLTAACAGQTTSTLSLLTGQLSGVVTVGPPQTFTLTA